MIEKEKNLIYDISHNKLEAVQEFIKSGNVNVGLDCISPHFLKCDHLLRSYDNDSTGAYYYDDHWFNITPLHYAAVFHASDIVQLLLDNGADVTFEDSIGMTALSYAILGGSEKIALLLLEKGAKATSATHSVDIFDKSGKSKFDGNRYIKKGITPLHLAAEANFVCLVEALLKKGADPLAVDDNQRTPLQVAFANNAKAVINVLLQLSVAIQVPQVPLEAIDLLDSYLDTGKCNEELQPLIEPVLRDNYNRAFIGPGYSTEYNEMTLWKYGCMKKKGKALKFLLDNRFYLPSSDYPRGRDRHDGNPFSIAIRYGHSDLALILVNEKLYTPVQEDIVDAATCLPLLTVCLEAGLSLKPYHQGNLYINPLMASISPWTKEEASLATYAFMFANGAVFEQIYHGHCLLVEAAAQNNAKLLQSLEKHGVNFNLPDQNGITPLMKAASMGNLETVSYLVSAGAKLDLQNSKDQTALHLAINYSKIETARHLIEASANIRLADLSGLTALQLAEKRKLVEIVNLINSRK